MERNEYMNHIESLLSNNFEVYHDKNIAGRDVDLYGKWSMEFGRNFISKTMIIDKFECNEHCIVVDTEKITESFLEEFERFLEKCTVEIVNPHRDHKTTYITGIIVADEIDENVPKLIKSYKYTKNYMLTIRGWSIVRLVAVVLKDEEIYNNKASKDLVGKLSFENVDEKVESL